MYAFFFPACFQREKFFVAACLLNWRTKSSQNRVYSQRNEFAPIGANAFLSEMTPIYIGDKNENDRSPGSSVG